MQMIFVEGGSFKMGSKKGNPDEKPVHKVILSDFMLAETEVTQELWQAVIGKDPEELRFKGCDKCPVENVSWDDAQEFIKKLNELTSKNYQLPTEAQWEYSARGGTHKEGFKYAGSNKLDEVAWHGVA